MALTTIADGSHTEPNDFSIICRICLQKKQTLHSIFKNDNGDEETGLSSKIKLISKCQVDYGDGLPNKICTRCLNLLMTACHFKELSEQNDAKLRCIANKSFVREKSIKIENGTLQLKLENDFLESKNNVDKKNEIITKIGECSVVFLSGNFEIKCEQNGDSKLNLINDKRNVLINNETKMEQMYDMDNSDIFDSKFSPTNSDTDECLSKHKKVRIKILPLKNDIKSNNKIQKNNDNAEKINHKILPLSNEEDQIMCEANDEMSDDDLNGCIKMNKKILPLNKYEEQRIKKQKCFRNRRINNKNRIYQKVLPMERKLSGVDGAGLYECLICGTKYDHKSSLHNHMMTQHKDTKQYKCYGCHLTFKTTRERLIHEMRRCPNILPGAKYHCKECNVSFSKRSLYDIHMVKHKTGPASDTLEIENLLKCSQCDYTTIKKHLLHNHIKYKHLSSNNYVCETCGKHYTNHNTFISHKATHRPSVKKFKCAYCDYTTKYSTGLTSHQRTHTRECQYTCEQCGKSFITNGALHVHHKRHLGIRDYQCTLCEKNYARKCELVCHIESVHEKIRPYKCTMCDSAFYQKGKCQKHMQRVHKITAALDLPTIKKIKES